MLHLTHKYHLTYRLEHLVHTKAAANLIPVLNNQPLYTTTSLHDGRGAGNVLECQTRLPLASFVSSARTFLCHKGDRMAVDGIFVLRSLRPWGSNEVPSLLDMFKDSTLGLQDLHGLLLFSRERQ